MATIKEVADLAGVSVATVSRFLNTPDAVKQETREKVENAIEALSYRPNYLGRTLRLMETKRILVVLNTISNQFYSRVVRGIEERAKEDGYSVLLCVTRGNEDNLKELFADIAQYIDIEHQEYSPIIIGAACSTAIGYFNMFINRMCSLLTDYPFEGMKKLLIMLIKTKLK